ncbi:DUF4336 domain-containing protein [Rhodospira trueperi]|uniref:DUF4336 domain-containing protein n=1 Tax=Rhodospira trueperi TaxID=69960 RepID=A0A1G7HDR8_9PROT|nr:DUF4336 domain-containing protein [Rhodospira trueperi]SDE98565.1 protein of unknown function [Rhodospira trueperi]
MVLEPIDRDIWMVDGSIVSFYGLPYPTRAVIVRLPDGGLWVWSPVALTDPLRAALQDRGPVTHLVSPNALHHLWLADWTAAWPQATLWGPQSLIRKRPDLTFAPALEDAPPPAWADIIDQVWLRASPLLDEIVFFHRPSRTALITDYSQAFTESFLEAHWKPWQRWLIRLARMTEGHGRAPLELRLTTLNRRRARDSIRRVLDWNPERVVRAHGTCPMRDGRADLERAFAWVL